MQIGARLHFGAVYDAPPSRIFTDEEEWRASKIKKRPPTDYFGECPDEPVETFFRRVPDPNDPEINIDKAYWATGKDRLVLRTARELALRLSRMQRSKIVLVATIAPSSTITKSLWKQVDRLEEQLAAKSEGPYPGISGYDA